MALLPVLLVMAVACGAAEKPAPTTAPAAAKAPAAAPQKEAPAAAAPAKAPIAAPTATPRPADVVHPGKLTVMVGGLGNERMLPRYCNGECNTFGRLLHGYFATTSHQGGVLASGIESWKFNPDGTVWSFKLRKGARFHNGELVTAEDLFFSLTRSTDLGDIPEAATPTNKVEGRQISKTEITGPDEVTITFKTPYAGALVWRSDGHAGNLRMNILPAKLLGEPYDKAEAAYEKLPIGAGPMKMTSRSPGQSMSFERFEDYYYQPKYGAPEDRRPRFKSLDLHLVPELSTRVAALRAGQADLVESAEAVRGQVEGAGGRMIYAKESSYVALMLLGCWRPEVRCFDKRVRQALDYAIDREVILKTLYTPESYSMGGWGYVTPAGLGYTPAIKPVPFDPQKARELLAAAGYKVPGVAAGKDFGTIVINAWNAGDVAFIPDMAQLVAESWRKELGIDAKVQVTDRTLITQRWIAQQLVDHIRLEVNEARWDGTTIVQSRYNDFKNAQRVSEDPELARIIQEAFKVVDPGKRHDAMAKVYPVLAAEHHALPMGHTNLPWAASKRVLEWQPWSAAAFFNAHWTVRLAQ
jgi:ABC-type transport system substrate-binding protein